MRGRRGSHLAGSRVITIKEEFVGGAKITRAIKIGGWEALGMWLALKRYCAEHPSGGFIPDEDMDKLHGAPKNQAKAMKALAECGRLAVDGSRGHGLVERHELGWQLHHYEDHANTVEEELRREKARVRKQVWRAEQAAMLAGLRAGQHNGTESGQSHGTETRDCPAVSHGTEAGQSAGQSRGTPPAGGGAPARTRAHAPPNPTQPNPTSRGEDPPAPKPADPLGAQLRGSAPHQRADVLRVHHAWQTRFGLTGHKFRGFGDLDAAAVAEALDLHGEQICMRVLEFAPKDGMVSGRDDDKRVKHDSLRYIFGNAQAFARILRAANEESQENRESTVSRIARLKQQDPGAGAA